MKNYFDVFNGDADGICALLQLRLAAPTESILVTGVKRDIALLKRVPVHAAQGVTVLDVSMEVNSEALADLLAHGVVVQYFDHHQPGMVPKHPLLDAHIEVKPMAGTSIMVDHYLKGQFRLWGIVGTFGDNFDETAEQAAAEISLDSESLEALRHLGHLMNYNGYGLHVEDLHCPPATLYALASHYEDPREFIAKEPVFETLESGYQADQVHLAELVPIVDEAGLRVFSLPDAAWARRISGILANRLARERPESAHAVLTPLPGTDAYLVSVRAPLAKPFGADYLCHEFGGGGRPAAAGINSLAADAYENFLKAMRYRYKNV